MSKKVQNAKNVKRENYLFIGSSVSALQGSYKKSAKHYRETEFSSPRGSRDRGKNSVSASAMLLRTFLFEISICKIDFNISVSNFDDLGFCRSKLFVPCLNAVFASRDVLEHVGTCIT